jgi:hypothetical protein
MSKKYVQNTLMECYKSKKEIKRRKEKDRNELTPWSRVLLEKLIVTQLVKKFPPPPRRT